MTIAVRDKQNIYDISLQYFGDFDNVATIIQDNDLPWGAELTTGQLLEINAAGKGNEEVKSFFSLSGLVVQNGQLLFSQQGGITFDATTTTWDSTQNTFDQK